MHNYKASYVEGGEQAGRELEKLAELITLPLLSEEPVVIRLEIDRSPRTRYNLGAPIEDYLNKKYNIVSSKEACSACLKIGLNEWLFMVNDKPILVKAKIPDHEYICSYEIYHIGTSRIYEDIKNHIGLNYKGNAMNILNILPKEFNQIDPEIINLINETMQQPNDVGLTASDLIDPYIERIKFTTTADNLLMGEGLVSFVLVGDLLKCAISATKEKVIIILSDHDKCYPWAHHRTEPDTSVKYYNHYGLINISNNILPIPSTSPQFKEDLAEALNKHFECIHIAARHLISVIPINNFCLSEARSLYLSQYSINFKHDDVQYLLQYSDQKRNGDILFNLYEVDLDRYSEIASGSERNSESSKVYDEYGQNKEAAEKLAGYAATINNLPLSFYPVDSFNINSTDPLIAIPRIIAHLNIKYDTTVWRHLNVKVKTPCEAFLAASDDKLLVMIMSQPYLVIMTPRGDGTGSISCEQYLITKNSD